MLAEAHSVFLTPGNGLEFNSRCFDYISYISLQGFVKIEK